MDGLGLAPVRWEEPCAERVVGGHRPRHSRGGGGLAGHRVHDRAPAPVARRALDAMAAPFSTAPTDPADAARQRHASTPVSHRVAKENEADDDDEETVRNALLLTNINRPAESDPATETFHWWWRRAPPSAVIQSGSSAPAGGVGVEASGGNKMNNHHAANSYVSVNVADEQRRRSRGSDKWCSLASWRPREKWLLLLLVLVSAACLAFIGVSLVAVLRQHASAQSKCLPCHRFASHPRKATSTTRALLQGL